MIDAAVGGSLIRKMEDESYNLIEEMAFNNYQCPMSKANLRGLEVSLIVMP